MSAAINDNDFFSCQENCAYKTSLSSYKIIGTTCSDNCRTRFGGLRYQWRMYRQIATTGDWEEYTDLEELSDTGTMWINICEDDIYIHCIYENVY